MPWVASIASLGMGAIGGIMGGRSRRKMKSRMIQYLEDQDYSNKAFVADQRANIFEQEQRLEKGFKQARSRTLRKSYASKRRAVMNERKAAGKLEQRGLDSGLINSSVFQGARKGYSAETAQVLAEIDANVAETQQRLDLAETDGDLGILGARGELRALEYGLDKEQRSNWAMLNTGMPIGQHGGLAGGGGLDTDALGMLAEALLGGTAPKGADGKASSSFFNWLLG